MPKIAALRFGARIAAIMRSRFDTLDLMPHLNLPILLIHGTSDDTIPSSMSEELFQAANQPKQLWLISGAGHNDVEDQSSDEFVARVGAFAKLCLGNRK
jgi:fermentation-respiration switch protein FrsA (DUF1100 family)